MLPWSTLFIIFAWHQIDPPTLFVKNILTCFLPVFFLLKKCPCFSRNDCRVHLFNQVFFIISEFSNKNIRHYSKRASTYHLASSCVRDHDATSSPARHVWEIGSLNWHQFMLQWFIRIPVPFRENSNMYWHYCQLCLITKKLDWYAFFFTLITQKISPSAT